MNTILHDRTLQTLVDKIFPNPANEQATKRRASRDNGSTAQQRQSVTSPAPATVSTQQVPSSPGRTGAKTGRQTSGRSIAPAQATVQRDINSAQARGVSPHQGPDHQQVSFKVEPDTSSVEPLPLLDKPYLKTSGKLKVSQLSRYLSKKLCIPSSTLELVCAGEALASEHSLHFIKRTLWFENNTELVVNYRRNREVMENRI